MCVGEWWTVGNNNIVVVVVVIFGGGVVGIVAASVDSRQVLGVRVPIGTAADNWIDTKITKMPNDRIHKNRG